MNSEDSRCNVHLADVDGHEEPFNYCSIHHLDYYVDFKPEDRPTWEKFTDDCIRSIALKAQELRKQAKELVRQLSLVQNRVDGLSICLPGIINDTAFPYFEKEVNLIEVYHKLLRSLGYHNRTLAIKVDELHMRIDVHQDSYMDLRDALVCHSGLTAYGAQEHIKRRVLALGLAIGHTQDYTDCPHPPSTSPISTPPRISPPTSPLSQAQSHKTRTKCDSKPVDDTDEPLFNPSARDHLQAFLRRARTNRQQRDAENTDDSPSTQDSPAATSTSPHPRDLGARPRNNITVQPLSLPPVSFRTASSTFSSALDSLSAADFHWPQELLPNSVFSLDLPPEILDISVPTTNIWTPTPSAQPPSPPRETRRITVERQQEDNEVIFSRLNLVEEDEGWE
jgi:hypothetical protein